MTQWNGSEDARGAAELPLKPIGVPIDHYSHDSVELRRGAAARRRDRREIPQSVTITPSANSAVAILLRVRCVPCGRRRVSVRRPGTRWKTPVA